MNKWTDPFLCLLLIILIVSIHSSNQNSKESMEKGEEDHVILTQYREVPGRIGEKDSHFTQILKELKETVDGWLKSLNERIEREDVTRFEVRFLEILRSILEWVKEKIDSQLESAEEEMLEKKGKRKNFREIRQNVSPFSGVG